MPSAVTNYSPFADLYKVRWVMIYANGDRKYGMWSQQGGDRHTLASAQTRDGLISIGVEGLRHTTRATEMIYQETAQGFEQFKIEYAAQVPALAGKFLDKVGALKIHGKVYGLSVYFSDKPTQTARIDGVVSRKYPEG